MIKTTLKIDGMMCGMCEAHINDAIRRAFRVRKVSSSSSKGETVILSELPPDIEKLRETVNAAGYTFVSASTETAEKKGLFSFLRKR
ncbi:MAG: heavy-metal-associated domain-containing protein [Clostridia bacterium]|nr:heavy-metal-associated domain-containing protein [Clostridia bacterium]MCR4578274.1 heavy-metal-associated domain-containing protein [Clostridiales bacterium]